MRTENWERKIGKVEVLWEGHKDLSYVVMVKSTVEISQNFVAFSEYMNFTYVPVKLFGKDTNFGWSYTYDWSQ